MFTLSFSLDCNSFPTCASSPCSGLPEFVQNHACSDCATTADQFDITLDGSVSPSNGDLYILVSSDSPSLLSACGVHDSTLPFQTLDYEYEGKRSSRPQRIFHVSGTSGNEIFTELRPVDLTSYDIQDGTLPSTQPMHQVDPCQCTESFCTGAPTCSRTSSCSECSHINFSPAAPPTPTSSSLQCTPSTANNLNCMYSNFAQCLTSTNTIDSCGIVTNPCSCGSQPPSPPTSPPPLPLSPPPLPLSPPQTKTVLIRGDNGNPPYTVAHPFALELFVHGGIPIESKPIPEGTYIQTADNDRHKVVVVQRNTDTGCTISQNSFTHFENYKGYTFYAPRDFNLTYDGAEPVGWSETLELRKGRPISFSTQLGKNEVSFDSLPNNTFIRKGDVVMKTNKNKEHQCITCNATESLESFTSFERGVGYIISPSGSVTLTIS
jgi:hypothetical protein